MDVKQWNLTYSLFEDTPDKVAAAARACAAAIRFAIRPLETNRAKGSTTSWSRSLVSSSRSASWMKRRPGRQAQRMNVVPPLTADRAESVLHDLAMARVKGHEADPGRPGVEFPALTLEREGNELLAKGDRAGAQAKFAAAAGSTPARRPEQ